MTAYRERSELIAATSRAASASAVATRSRQHTLCGPCSLCDLHAAARERGEPRDGRGHDTRRHCRLPRCVRAEREVRLRRLRQWRAL